MFFLIESLTQTETLIPHQAWVLCLMFIMTLVFSGAAQLVRDGQGKRLANLVITAWFLWALNIDRLFILAGYILTSHPKYSYLMPTWVLLRHLSLLSLEFPVYAMVYILLKDNIKAYLRNRLRGFLDN